MEAIAHDTLRPADFADPDDYQRAALVTWTRNPTPGAPLLYLALGVVDESGEVAGKVKKMHRDNDGRWSPDLRRSLCKELGDVLWYTAVMAHEAGHTLSSVVYHATRHPSRPNLLGRYTMARAAVLLCIRAGRLADCADGPAGLWLDALAEVILAIDAVSVCAGLTLPDIMAANINKLRGRQARGTIHGNGDDR